MCPNTEIFLVRIWAHFTGWILIPIRLFVQSFKDTLKVLDDFKNKQKSVWSKVFWYVKVWSVFNTLYLEIKRRMLKEFPSGKINGTKNALFFLSRAPTHHSLTFNLRFLYELKHKVRLSKTMRRIFHFWFCFVFIKVYIFVQQNAWTLWL